MVLVALAPLFEFACAHETARVKVHIRIQQLDVGDRQLDHTEAEAVYQLQHRASHSHLAKEGISATAIPLRNCKPANKEPWQLDIRFVCMFANPMGGFDYFYKLQNDLFMCNCFCACGGSREFGVVFEDTMLGGVLTSPEEEGVQCDSRANGSSAWVKIRPQGRVRMCV